MTVSKISIRLMFTILLSVLSTVSGSSVHQQVGITVTLKNEKSLVLRINLHSNAEVPVALYAYKLPWGSKRSMVLVAVKGDRKVIEDKYFAIDDPSPERLTIEPNGILSGELDLRQVLPNLEKALRESDVQLFWAYEAPAELNIGQWSGGWVLIPRQK